MKAAPRPLGLLSAVTVSAWNEERQVATLRLDDEHTVEARLGPSLSPLVVQTAVARGELVIAREGAEGWQLLGALRTAPTPGVDRGEEYVIEAQRIRVTADYELALTSGTAQLVLRALGMVETIARTITSRAEGVHKLIGRVLHLN